MEYETSVIDLITRSAHAISVRFVQPDQFSYLPGMYILLTVGKGEEAQTKPLSISGSPTDPYLEITKGLTGHPFSQAITNLLPESIVKIRGPLGNFTFRDEPRKVVFLAGGIGITPFRSMIRFASAKGLATDIILIYSCRTEEEIVFREEFAELEQKNPRLHILITLTAPSPEWKGHRGRITREFIEQEIPDWKERDFFASGPVTMVNGMISLLQDLGVRPDRIKHENIQ